jgi:tape measure domain-containing protein
MGLEDFARFGLELVDRVTDPGKAAASQIDLIAKKLKKTQKLASLTSREMGSVATAMAKRGIGRGMDVLGKGMAFLAAGATAAASAFGAFVGKTLVQGVVHMAMFAENTRRAYGYLLHDQGKGNAAFSTATKLADEFGMGVENVGHQLQHMLAMQFKVGEATDLIKLSQDLQAIGASSDQANRALTALTQIKAKGKLQSEELVGQLAETGVSTVLVYEALAKNLGKSQDEIKKLLGTGAITADQGIKAIKQAIMHKVGETAPGQAAKGFLENTFAGAVQRLKNLGPQMYLRMADNMGPAALAKINTAIRSITDAITKMDTAPFERFVTSVLELAATLAPLVKEVIVGFGDGMADAMSSLSLFIGPSSLGRARDIGLGIANICKGVLIVIGAIAGIISFLSTPAGQLLGVLTVVLFTIWKIVGAIAAVRALLTTFKSGKGAGKVGKAVAEKFIGRDDMLDFEGGGGGGGGGGPAKQSRGWKDIMRSSWAWMRQTTRASWNTIKSGWTAGTTALKTAAQASGRAIARFGRAIGPALAEGFSVGRAAMTTFVRVMITQSRLLGAAGLAGGRVAWGWLVTAAIAVKEALLIIGAAVIGASVGVILATTAALIAWLVVAWEVYHYWDDLKAGMSHVFDNLKQTLDDFIGWVFKWGLRLATLGLSRAFEKDEAATQGERDVNADIEARRAKPQLNPAIAAAANGGKSPNLTIHEVNVSVTDMDHKGDPKRAGERVVSGIAESSALDTMWLQLGGA